MTKTAIHRYFSILRKILPTWAHDCIRRVATIFLGPILFAHRTGYAKSALKQRAVSKNGEPLPWYSYPSIDFLKHRNYQNKIILEFGGGQSTLWWAKIAKHVVTLEGDKQWYEKIKEKIQKNVDLCHVSMACKEQNIKNVTDYLASKEYSKYDVIIIDGLYRYEMIKIALAYMQEDGLIICDNAEGFGFYEGFKASGLSRVDFFGNAPGVLLPHATSIYFKPTSFVFDATHPIPAIATEA